MRVMTPDKTIYDEAVDFVLLRTSRGDMGVLAGHEPFASILAHGQVQAFVNKEQVAVFEARGGFAMIEDDTVSVLTGLAGRTEEMEGLLAGMEEARAQRKEREDAANIEMRRAEEALRRALVHREVSDDAIIKGRGEQYEE